MIAANKGRYGSWEGIDDYVSLICAMIRTAVIDYRRDCTKYNNKYQRNKYIQQQVNAKNWFFKSNSRQFGSFHWCCEMLDLDPQVILDRLDTCDISCVKEANEREFEMWV